MAHVVGAEGQVVIPRPIREFLDLHPGTEMRFQLLERGVAVIPVGREDSLKGAFAGYRLVDAFVEGRTLEPK